MRRYVSRHLSVRNHRNYLPLSSSDTQLDSAAPECQENYARYNPDEVVATRDEKDEVGTTQPDSSSTGKRRWFRHLRRRKKRHGDGDAVVGQQQAGVRVAAASPCDDLEVAVEASLNVELRGSHVAEPHGSFSTPCATTDDAALGLQALDLATTINKSDFYHRHHTGQQQQQLASRPPARRRFAICEELEREMIMENGMNLRKSRKNLVIRQVLHDLLLL